VELSDSFRVGAPASEVWELFWDFPRLASCLPGCDAIEVIDDSNLKARVGQKIGPFKVAMDLKLTIVEVTPGRRIVAMGGGGDRMGNRLKINHASLEVEAISLVETQVSYNLNFTLFGKLGTLGYPVVKRKVEEMRSEFTRRMIDALQSSRTA